jgi:hypothetical protein
MYENNILAFNKINVKRMRNRWRQKQTKIRERLKYKTRRERKTDIKGNQEIQKGQT